MAWVDRRQHHGVVVGCEAANPPCQKKEAKAKKIYDADPGPWLSDTSANQLSFLLQPL